MSLFKMFGQNNPPPTYNDELFITPTGTIMNSPLLNLPDTNFEEVNLEKLRLQCLELVMAEVISKSEYRKLIKMLYSPDHENWVMAEEILKTKISEL